MTKKTILFVDDERDILNGLRRSLYPLCDRWNMLFVESGARAIEIMQQQKVNVVITDMRMPVMNGVQLLQTVRKGNPETIRIMLTGQADKDIYNEAMALCHYFFWKPTVFEDFEVLFHRLHCLDATLHNDNLVRLIGGIGSLPSLPILFSRLMLLLEQDETDCLQVAGIIREDMAMAGQVMKLVNSSFFGLAREIGTLEDAVTYLGVKTIASLVLVKELFSQCRPAAMKEFQLDQLWQHSFCVATKARKIASVAENGAQIQDCAYLAGLLHDIGKLLLATHLPESYREIRENALRTGRPCAEVELDILGADHATIGGYLISLWGLPRRITEAVLLHHTSPSAGDASISPVLQAVGQANRLCFELCNSHK
jgi:HD-like signal output (HDOD) protein/ActR/RegA family two-component response regulator